MKADTKTRTVGLRDLDAPTVKLPARPGRRPDAASRIATKPPTGPLVGSVGNSVGIVARSSDPRWKGAAACIGRTDLFFARGSYREAKRICNEECPVTAECLAFALADPVLQTAGVLGGLSPKGRRDLAGRGS